MEGVNEPSVDVSWTLQKIKTIPSGNTIWRLKICVKNTTGKKIEIAVAGNPWRAPDDTEKTQYDRKDGAEVRGSDAKYAKEGAKKLELEDVKVRLYRLSRVQSLKRILPAGRHVHRPPGRPHVLAGPGGVPACAATWPGSF